MNAVQQSVSLKYYFQNHFTTKIQLMITNMIYNIGCCLLAIYWIERDISDRNSLLPKLKIE